MDFINQFTKIETDDNLMEIVSHGSEEYPFHYYYENLALFDFNCVDWHWHSEFEFVYIESGEVTFDIGETHFELAKGQGIMINSKVLHRLQSERDAIIPNFLFKPSFIAPTESLIYEKYVKPVLMSSVKYIIFNPHIPWQAKVIEIMGKIITSHDLKCKSEIYISMCIQEIWCLLQENLAFDSTENKIISVSRVRLQLMMQFIHEHYFENIDLEDISNSANISKSTALNLFHSNLKLTPINYLISYRLKQAALLLSNTEKKISAISYETGFNNVDHFCRSFKKAYKITPTDYRNQSALVK